MSECQHTPYTFALFSEQLWQKQTTGFSRTKVRHETYGIFFLVIHLNIAFLHVFEESVEIKNKMFGEKQKSKTKGTRLSAFLVKLYCLD